MDIMPEITLILHNIRSTYNVGSIFRTAEGFGIKEIVISGYTPYPKLAIDSRLPHIYEKLTDQIHKTALGAEQIVPFRYIEDLTSWINQSKLPLVALEQAPDSIPLPEFKPPTKLALLLGEEVRGIAPELLSKCSSIIEIPMFGQKESFNVSVAAGIALYDLMLPSARLYEST